MNESYGITYGVRFATFAKNGRRVGTQDIECPTLDTARDVAQKFGACYVAISFGLVYQRVSVKTTPEQLIRKFDRLAVNAATNGDCSFASDALHVARAIALSITEQLDSTAAYITRSRQAEERRNIMVNWGKIGADEDNAYPTPVIEYVDAE